MASQKCFLGLLVNLNSWPQNPRYGPGFWLFPLPPLFFSQTLLTEENSIFAWALPQPMSWAFKTLRIGYIYISKTPTCWWQWWGSTGGHFRHSVSVWCGTDSTGDVVVWQEETTVQKRKWKKKNKKRERQHTKQQMCAGEWPCSWQVLWCDLGRGREHSLACLSLMWPDMKPGRRTGGGDGWTKAPFLFSRSSFSLSLLLTHARTQTSAVCLIHCCLPRSVNLICPTMLPPTFLRSLILSCPFSIPLSLIFFLAPALSRFPPSGLWVCHAVQSSGHGCGSRPASNG